MVEQVLDGEQSKPYSGSLHNSNSSLVIKSSKKDLKSQLLIEEPTSDQDPVVVSYFKQKQEPLQYLTDPRWWLRNPKYESNDKRLNLYRWYKRKRALKSLKDQYKKEIKRIREEYETQRLNDIILWEYENQNKARKEAKKRRNKKSRHQPKFIFDDKKNILTIKDSRNWSRMINEIKIPVEIKDKKRTLGKEKPAKVNPRAQTKQVYMKKYIQKDSLTTRFVNCFYRVCCQCYCWLTCILIIAFAIIMLL